MDGHVSLTPEQVTGCGGGPKTRVPIRHAVRPSFEGFDSRWGLRPPSFMYLQLETRERVQTNEAKSKRRRASPTYTTSRRDNTASQCLPFRRALTAG